MGLDERCGLMVPCLEFKTRGIKSMQIIKCSCRNSHWSKCKKAGLPSCVNDVINFHLMANFYKIKLLCCMYIDNHCYNNQSLSPIIIPNREAKLVASNYPQLSGSIGWVIVALYEIVFIYQDHPIFYQF